MLKVIFNDEQVCGSTADVLCKRLPGVDEIDDDVLKAIRSANRRGVPIYGDICPYVQEINGVSILVVDEDLERLDETDRKSVV